MVTWPRHEMSDLGAHENPSHTAIATRPTNASDIRYAVMLPSRYHSSCHCEEQSDEAIQQRAESGFALRSLSTRTFMRPVGGQRRFKICGMIAYHAIISGANPIPPGAIRGTDRCGGAARGRGLGATPPAGTFARAG